MPTIDDLEPLLATPAEALDVEHKRWLDLRGNDEHKALLAKAVIALANEGGGVIVIGYREERPTSSPNRVRLRSRCTIQT
jgi:predicted HTH transcriptional regulator